MLDIIGRYTDQHQYNIHSTKTKIVPTNATIHLGLQRTNKRENEINIDDRIKLARRAKYSLMSSGLHGTNGVDPITGYNIYKTYILPRLLYGLEILPLTKGQIEILEKFHKNTLRHIQSRSQRTATSAIYLLLGAIPVEGELHKRQLSMLYSLLSAKNQTIQDLLQRQSSINFDNPKSFFFCSMETLQIYNLPNIWELQSNLPIKSKWKTLVNFKMSNYWNNALQIDTVQKTSLKYLAIKHIKTGKPHISYTTL
ncbi:unnamed protein product [Mytilus coruscus]|uniref:Reverse transcriptase domain-containing protein n=1 Tax=Mytilus coruscus TaxID=42192 RepID=A0A6J7ZW76_MYTCO|nr:unnamed protein product [Mytilus coruscus]